MRIKTFFALAGCSVFMAAAMATAAHADQEKVLVATVQGPGLATPIELKLSDVFTLEYALGVSPASDGYPEHPPSAESLGPRYSVRYFEKLADGKVFHLHQDLYPYARGEPWVFTPPGQRLFNVAFGGAFLVRSGWYGSPDPNGLAPLTAAGLPSSPHGAHRTAWGRAVVLGGALIVVLAALSGVAMAKGRRPRADAGG